MDRLSKRQRIVDEELLAAVRRLPCLGCLNSLNVDEARLAISENERSISHPHHWVSRGAGGDDIASNLIALCVEHHTEIHKIGNKKMREKYPCIDQWARLTGKDDEYAME